MINKNNYYLIKELTLRDISSRYKGSMLGVAWTLLTPISMLLVFTFVFGEIFQAKWPGVETNSMFDFSINLFIGLSLFWYFADVLTKAPTLIISSPNYVKKVVFPLEILPVVAVLSALFHFLINIVIIIVAIGLNKGGFSFEMLWVMVVIVMSIPLLLGLGWFLSSVGVYVRDIVSVVGVVVNMLMFLSPVFFPLSSVGENLQWLFHLNPLTLPIGIFRDGFILGQSPLLFPILIYTVFSLLTYVIGLKVFRKLKGGFADVI